MLDSFGRGLKMIWASIKMGLKDQRLLLPSVLTVFANFFFAILLFGFGEEKLSANLPGLPGLPGLTGASAPSAMAGMARGIAHNPQHLLRHGHQPGIMNLAGAGSVQPGNIMDLSGVNGPLDMSGFQAMGAQVGDVIFSQNTLIVLGLLCLWWLTNRFLEGVTTALTYSHLTDGPGSGKFSLACRAVFESLPAIIVLGICTFIARNLAKWMRYKRGTGMFGIGVNFLAGIVEVFWTLAGHLILPAIVIEGTSFVGAMKRADRIASGNLLAIGVGEVGVDGICRFVSWIVYLVGAGAAGLVVYLKMFQHTPIPPAVIGLSAVAWACLAIVVTAFSIYIRAAFYTCLYVWAIEAESVAHTERVLVRPPAPLAHALA